MITSDWLPSLAVGGVLAAVAAGWSQVKSFLSYASSFIVVHAHLDSSTSFSVRLHLKQHYKTVPSGHLWYVCSFFSTPTSDHLRVPFRAHSPLTVFYRRREVLFARYKSGALTLSSFRGLIDFDAIVATALREHDVLDSRDLESRSNFYVRQVIGAEKGMAFGSQHNSRLDSSETPLSTGNHGMDSEDSGTHLPIDYEVDGSFAYAQSTYRPPSNFDPFEHLFYPEEVTRYIDQAVTWMNSRLWYQERGIPWRRGWLLHGPGGTGKSSLARALAQKLRIPLNHFYLSTLSDQEFIREWDSLATPSVVLLEDFDTVYDKRVNLTEHKLLSFDTILNKISGVGSSHGIFLIVTTNHLDKIDEALGVSWDASGISTRPGRIDHVIHLGYMEREQRHQMANQVLRDWPDAIQPLVDDPRDITPIQFQEMCAQEAFRQINREQAVWRAA